MRLLVTFTACLLLAAACLPAASESGELGATAGAIESGGLSRTYLVHTPASRTPGTKSPLVLVLHGGKGTGRGMIRLSAGSFNRLADRDGFVVAYPDGFEKGWNDGRKDLNQAATLRDLDDVGFLCSLIDRLAETEGVDPGRVFSCGISNGGFMSQRLAHDRPGRVRAVASVAACLGLELSRQQQPPSPVSVMLMLGDEDPLVPFGGGLVHLFRVNRGRCLSAADSVRYWCRANGCSGPAQRMFLADRDPDDGTRTASSVHANGAAGSEVVLLTVQGGGHTWPGGWQYLPQRVIGRTSRDFDAAEEIWAFFKRHLGGRRRL